MRIYDINQSDGTVINPAGRDAPADPMRQTPRIPAGATDIEPPATGEREVARWAGDNWELVPDWRGHMYWTEDGERHEIKELGTEPPADALDEAPPAPLTDLAATKKREMDAARDADFAAGLSRDITGEPDVVQTRPQDQINLLGLHAKSQTARDQGVTDAVMKFRGAENVTRMLTPDEMYQLTNDALAHIEGIYDHSWARKDEITAVLDDEALDDDAKREALDAITW